MNIQYNLNIQENNLNTNKKNFNDINNCEYETYRCSSNTKYILNNNEYSSTDRLNKLKTFSTEEANKNTNYRNNNKKICYCKSSNNINNYENIFNEKQSFLREFQNEIDNSQKYIVNKKNKTKILKCLLDYNNLNFKANSLIKKNKINNNILNPQIEFNKILFENRKEKDIKNKKKIL